MERNGKDWMGKDRSGKERQGFHTLAKREKRQNRFVLFACSVCSKNKEKTRKMKQEKKSELITLKDFIDEIEEVYRRGFEMKQDKKSELKTLRDLKSLLIKDKIVVDYDELKAEAIKWVKAKCKTYEDGERLMWDTDWLDFFNLTEEDLK